MERRAYAQQAETTTTETTTETSETSAAVRDTSRTPDFIGLTEEDAVRLCEENNYEYIIERQCVENIYDTVGVVATQDALLNRVNNGNSITQEVTYVLTIYEEFTPSDIPERNCTFQLESYSMVTGDMGINLIGKEYAYDETGHIVKVENYYGTGIYKSGNEIVDAIAEFNISYNSDYSEITIECKSSYFDPYYKECWENGEDLSEKYRMPNPDEFPDEPIKFYCKGMPAKRYFRITSDMEFLMKMIKFLKMLKVFKTLKIMQKKPFKLRKISSIRLRQ